MSEHDRPHGGPIIVHEDIRVSHFLWGMLLTVALGGLWAVITFVKPTGENRIAMYVITIVPAVIFAARWIYEVRHPARLEISYEAIAERRRGRQGATVLPRTTGEISEGMVSRVIAGHGAVAPVLTIPGCGDQIVLSSYDRKKVRQACEQTGWRFVEPDS